MENPRSKAKSFTLIREFLPPAVVFVLAAFVYSRYGLHGELARTDASLGTMDHAREEFDQQRQAALETEDRFGNDAKLVYISVPQLLVLQHQTNPTPYAYIAEASTIRSMPIPR